MRRAGWLAGLQVMVCATSAAPQSLFDYDRAAPLSARITQRTDTVGFFREKVVFDGGRGWRVPALIAVPANGPPRHPVIVLVDGIGGWKERWWQATSWNRGRILIDSLLAAGFAVAMADAPASGERTFENDFVSAEAFVRDTAKWRDMGIRNAVEQRRLIDYLATRGDVDSTRIGMLGLSHGGMMTFALAAEESRIRAAVVGLTPMHRIPRDLLPGRHSPRVTIPFMMFAATNDGWYTREQVGVVFAALSTRDKQLVWYEGGHRPPVGYAAAAVDWFRRAIGPPVTSR